MAVTYFRLVAKGKEFTLDSSVNLRSFEMLCLVQFKTILTILYGQSNLANITLDFSYTHNLLTQSWDRRCIKNRG